MHQRAYLSTFLVLCLAIILVAAFPDNGHGRAYQSSRAASPGCNRHDGHVFPFLRWLRNSAVEIVFGRPKGRGRDGGPRRFGGAAQSKYRNDIVVRFNVTGADEEAALSEAADRLFLDIWAFTTTYVDVRLHKDDVASLMTLLPKDMRPSVLIPNVAAAAWATYPRMSADRKHFDEGRIDSKKLRNSVDAIDDVFFQDYQPLSVITSWMRLLANMFPTYVNMTSIGKSYEGRDIPAIRMGYRLEGDTVSRPRKTIVIMGGIHAREWISTSTVNYLIWSFTASYGKEPLVTKLLQHFDVVFIPIGNPDGYEYTWESDRLWRKSRQQTSMRFCRGLDLDHAFGYEWDAAAHKSDPCSESYGGDKPFQAVEASQVADWAKKEANNGVEFIGLLDLHSYSQQILFPYSYTCDVDPPNRENLEELAAGLAKAIRLASGELYGVASACEGAVLKASGESGSSARIESGGGSVIDWFYHDLKAHYSYQVKLRDTGNYGFLLPPENIVPTGEEMFQAVKYFGDFLLGNNGIERLADGNEEQSASREDADMTELRRRKRR